MEIPKPFEIVRATTSEESPECTECIICTENFDSKTHLWTVTPCRHAERICSLCYFRLRSCKVPNFNCPTCKQNAENVICTTNAKIEFYDLEIWNSERIEGYDFDASSRMFFPSQYYRQQIATLRSYKCNVCHQIRRDFKQLKGHYYGEHQLQICLLCHDYKQCFPSELIYYTQEAFEQHIRYGNRDGSSGHPQCEFCRTRFYDSSKLFEHLTENHKQCPLCDTRGIKYRYFQDEITLVDHYRKDHFLCDEPNCMELKYVVFHNEIDLMKHRKDCHPHLNVGRNIPIRFTYKTNVELQNTKESNRPDGSHNTGGESTIDSIHRIGRYEGGLGGKANQGEWQVEFEALATDPRDIRRSTALDLTNHHNNNSGTTSATAASTMADSSAITNTNTEDFPTLGGYKGKGEMIGSWVKKGSVVVDEGDKFKTDFPSLPFNNSKPKKMSIHNQRSLDLQFPMKKSTKQQQQQPQQKKISTKEIVASENPSTMTNWNSSGIIMNRDFNYENDLARAIEESLRDHQLSNNNNNNNNNNYSNNNTATQNSLKPAATTNTAHTIASHQKAMSVEEAFPSLQVSVPPPPPNNNSTTSTTTANMNNIPLPQKKANNNKNGPQQQQQSTSKQGKGKGKPLSQDLAEVMKAIGKNPNHSKKPSSGLSIIRPKKNNTNTNNDNTTHPPPPNLTSSSNNNIVK
jgi:hypothetical protein